MASAALTRWVTESSVATRVSSASGSANRSQWLCGILQRMELWMGPLSRTEWPAARALLHRAFVNEPFTNEMYGPELLDRWGGSWGLYSSLMIERSTVALGGSSR